MKRSVVIATVVALLSSSCVGGGSQQRAVQIDFSHDQFASFFLKFFPSKVTVHPGDTVVFRQTWTGEPHTVSMGKLVDRVMGKGRALIDFFDAYARARTAGVDLPDPDNPPSKYGPFYEHVGGIADKLFSSLPLAHSDNGVVAQNLGRPCYLETGNVPEDSATPCPKRKQPIFTGRQAFYSSGIIPYEGPQGNQYRVQLAPSIKPGSYNFYCAVHGPGQSGVIDVVSATTPLPTQSEVEHQTRAEIDRVSKPLLELFQKARRTNTLDLDGQTITGPFGGLPGRLAGNDETGVDEFLPRRITTKVGQQVTWKLMGSDHTVSFNVPKYFPIYQFRKDGRVVQNPKVGPPAGGSPPVKRTEDEPLAVDGGTWNGKGFFSSGIIGSDPYARYSLRFSQPGTYRYACLIHPPMVGTVVVTE